MVCKEKWVFWWREPGKKRKQKITIYNEDEAARFFVEKATQGIDTKHKFYDCGPKDN